MKKTTLFSSSAALLLAAGLFLSSCSKDDTTSPVVTLTGSSSMTISLNSSFSDPGATANDDEDGTITATVSGSVDKDTKGTYVLTYSATDAAGNTGTATRTVYVVNDAEKYAGTYSDSLYAPQGTFVLVFTQTISTSATKNNRIIFSKLGDYANNNTIFADISGTSVDIPSQTSGSIGGSGCIHTFAPSGSPQAITQPTAGKYKFSVVYADTRLAGGAGCTASGPVITEEVLIQQ